MHYDETNMINIICPGNARLGEYLKGFEISPARMIIV